MAYHESYRKSWTTNQSTYVTRPKQTFDYIPQQASVDPEPPLRMMKC